MNERIPISPVIANVHDLPNPPNHHKEDEADDCDIKHVANNQVMVEHQDQDSDPNLLSLEKQSDVDDDVYDLNSRKEMI